MYDVCRYCENGKDRIDLINVWRHQLGFRNPVTFRPSFNGKFFGNTLKMGTFWLSPNIHIVGKYENGSNIIDGTHYRNYKIIAEKLNFTLNFVPHLGINKMNFGKYAADLKSGKTDMVGGGWTCKYSRYLQTGDVSASFFHVDGYHIVSIEPLKKSNPWSALVKPFKVAVWIGVFFIIFVSSFILYIVRRFSQTKKGKGIFWNSLWDIVVITCWDKARCPQPSWAIIFHLSFYMLAHYVLLSVYFGEYSAHVVFPSHATPPIDTLEQLWKTDMKWVSGYHGHTNLWLNYFKYVPDIKERHFNFTLQENETFGVSALRKIATHPYNMVFLQMPIHSKFEIMKHFITPAGRSFYFSKESFLPSYQCNYYKQNFYGKEAMNKMIMRLRDSGIEQHNDEAYKLPYEVKYNLKIGKPLHEVQLDLITIEHFYVILVIVSVAYILCTVCLFIEIIVFASIHRKLINSINMKRHKKDKVADFKSKKTKSKCSKIKNIKERLRSTSNKLKKRVKN